MAKRKPNKPKSTGKVTKRKLQRAVVDLFSQSPKKQFNYKQISSAIGATNVHDRELVVKILAELKAKETLKEPSRGKYQLAKPMPFIQGRVDLTQSGSAYVITDQVKEDIYIPPKFVGHALQGDTVNVF